MIEYFISFIYDEFLNKMMIILINSAKLKKVRPIKTPKSPPAAFDSTKNNNKIKQALS